METEAAVTAAAETVASNVPTNKTVIVAALALTTGVAVTIAFKKVQDRVKARIVAKRLAAETQE